MRLSRYDDDDEDFALSAMGISDGFRPSNGSAPAPVPFGHQRTESRTSRREAAGRRTPPPRPSSTTKPRGLGSFSLQNDGSTGSSQPFTSSTFSSNDQNTLTRASSISTDMPYIAPETPYQGPSGPSHPYHMYPQGTRPSRTASVATASTFQPRDRSYVGPSGPQHPYGMYPQDTTADEEHISPIPAIPVGFPGRSDQYRRRLGPDGEEAADMIGPMGHTEELPPYSQYPTESFGKASPVRGVPLVAGAGGIGLATLNPEFESRDDLRSPVSRQSMRSLTSESSGPQLNMAAAQESEKPPMKRWKQIAHKRVCGVVPVWALVLVGAALLLFTLILGAVLGFLAGRHRPPPRHNPGYQ
jgi:hypothetical protein